MAVRRAVAGSAVHRCSELLALTQISPQYVIIPDERQTNMLGIVGFVLSLLGILGTGGLLCPVGLVLSLIALGRPPRGFAVAGVVLGLLGTCGGIILAIFIIGIALTAIAGVGAMFVLSQSDRIELSSDMAKIGFAVQQYKEGNRGIAPAGLSGLELERPTLLDPWGHEYRYFLTDNESGFDVMSNGADGVENTDDDIALSKLCNYWEGAFEDFKRKMEELDAKQKRLKMGVEVGVEDQKSEEAESAPAPQPDAAPGSPDAD